MKHRLIHQKGSMLVEFLVVAGSVLISLFILIPYLAKVTDLRHKNEQSAQYASWERTVHRKQEGKALENSAKQRVLNDSNALISSNSIAFKADSFHHFVDSKTGSANYSLLLGARGTTDNFLSIKTKADDKGRGNITDSRDTITTAVSAVTKVVSNLTTFEPRDKDDYYKTTSELTVKQPSWMKAFTQDSQIMSTEKTILVDGWGVKGRKDNEKIVNRLQPKIFNEKGDVDIKKGLEIYVEVYNVLADAIKVITINSLDIDDDLDELYFDYVDTELLLYPDGNPNNNGQTNNKETGEQLGTY